HAVADPRPDRAGREGGLGLLRRCALRDRRPPAWPHVPRRRGQSRVPQGRRGPAGGVWQERRGYVLLRIVETVLREMPSRLAISALLPFQRLTSWTTSGVTLRALPLG